MTMAEVKAPTRIATCCFQGVAPTRKPVFRSCDVVPPLDDAMQTTPAIDSAVSRYSGPTQPSTTKIRQVRSSVAIVMPEIGLDDEPITPVMRELTVTNRNPNNTIIAPPIKPARQVGGDQVAGCDRQHQSERAEEDHGHRQVALGAEHSALAGRLARAQVAQAAGHATRRSCGRALIMLKMPPVATAPAPM